MEPVGKKTMRPRIGEKKEKNNPFSNNLPDQNEDVLFNPINSVNPDSKPNCKRPKAQTHPLQHP
jgi:hypothetical protein